MCSEESLSAFVIRYKCIDKMIFSIDITAELILLGTVADIPPFRGDRGGALSNTVLLGLNSITFVERL